MYIRELIVHVYFTQSTNFTILYTIKKCVQLLCYFAFKLNKYAMFLRVIVKRRNVAQIRT